jgi:hypothetical protein
VAALKLSAVLDRIQALPSPGEHGLEQVASATAKGKVCIAKRRCMAELPGPDNRASSANRWRFFVTTICARHPARHPVEGCRSPQAAQCSDLRTWRGAQGSVREADAGVAPRRRALACPFDGQARPAGHRFRGGAGAVIGLGRSGSPGRMAAAGPAQREDASAPEFDRATCPCFAASWARSPSRCRLVRGGGRQAVGRRRQASPVEPHGPGRHDVPKSRLGVGRARSALGTPTFPAARLL